MMTEAYWQDVIGLIRVAAPTDLNGLVGMPERTGQPSTGFPAHCIVPAPSARLWTLSDPSWSCIGVRVSAPVADPPTLALRLAAAAVERHMLPVMLTRLAQSGFERFGFRTERIFGATEEERAACEAELARFWGFAIVIDASDVTLLG